MKQGWTYKKLGEVCIDFIVPQRDKPTAFEGNIPWCRIEDIEGRYLNGSKSSQNVTKELADKMNMHLCPKGTVISACSASIGRQAITTVDCYTNQTFIGLVVNPDLLYNIYLFYFLESQTNSLLKLGQGATIKYISKDKYKQMLIPLPPVSEQQRIVERLDAAFAHIDELKANAEKQVSEARALFQKALEKAMEPKDGWEEKKLGELFNLIGGGTPSKKESSYYGGDIPWATVRDMNCDILSSTEYMITEEGLNDSSSHLINKGEIIIATRVGLGKVCKLAQPTAINQDLKGVIPKKEIIDRNFLFYYFKSIAKYIEENGVGATVKGVKIKFVEDLLFPLTDSNEQQRIVARLDSLSENVKKLEEVERKTIAECDALKQALLRKVFE